MLIQNPNFVGCWRQKGKVKQQFELRVDGKVVASLRRTKLLSTAHEGTYDGKAIIITPGVEAEILDKESKQRLAILGRVLDNIPKEIQVINLNQNEHLKSAIFSHYIVEMKSKDGITYLTLSDSKGELIAAIRPGGQSRCTFSFESKNSPNDNPHPGIIAIILFFIFLFHTGPSV